MLNYNENIDNKMKVKTLKWTWDQSNNFGLKWSFVNIKQNNNNNTFTGLCIKRNNNNQYFHRFLHKTKQQQSILPQVFT